MRTVRVSPRAAQVVPARRPGIASHAAAPVAAALTPGAGGDAGAVAVAPAAPAPARAPAAPARAVSALLRDLGPQLRRGGTLDEPLEATRDAIARDATGLPGVDALLDGGIPRGRILEISGPRSSGRTALALGCLARITRAGEVVAWVDVADALDPPSAAASGVVLSRLLWVRTPGLREALRASERLLATRGFAWVVLDLDVADSPEEQAGGTAWLKLARSAARSRTSLALLSTERQAGTFSDLALELRPAGVRFSPSPALLEGLAARAVLVRNRLGPPGCECDLVIPA